MVKLSELLDSYIYIISNRRKRELTEGGGLRVTPFCICICISIWTCICIGCAEKMRELMGRPEDDASCICICKCICICIFILICIYICICVCIRICVCICIMSRWKDEGVDGGNGRPELDASCIKESCERLSLIHTLASPKRGNITEITMTQREELFTLRCASLTYPALTLSIFTEPNATVSFMQLRATYKHCIKESCESLTLIHTLESRTLVP